MFFFPKLYNDEDIRSVIFRYAKMHTFNNVYNIIYSLWGTGAYRALTPFLGHLYDFYMLSLNPPYENFNDFLEMHTYVPFCRLFYSEEYQNRFIDYLKYGKTSSGSPNPNIYKFISKDIRYCYCCMRDEYEKLGECYIHRIHQINIYSHCYKHKTKLISRCEQCGNLLSDGFRYQLHSSKCNSCGKEILNKINRVKDETGVIESSLETLNQLMSHRFSLSELHIKIVSRIAELGYISMTGDINKKKLISDFILFFEEEHFEKKEKYLTHWFIVRFLNEKFYSVNVPLYLDMIKFLFRDINILNYNNAYSWPIPFGKGPWTCINKLCPKFGEFCISVNEKCVIKTNLVGLFTCPNCNMVYGRKYIDGEGSDKTYIIEYGELWNNEVVNLNNKGLSLRLISKKTGTDRKIVKKFLSGLQKQKNTLAYEKVKYIEEKRNEMREYFQTLLRALEKKSDVTRESVRLMGNPHKYRWMMRYDREWFESVLPTPLKKKPGNYILFDKEMTEYYKLLIMNIKTMNPNEKVTRGYILKQTTNSVYRNRLIGRIKNNFTETNKIIDDSVESTEEYIKRTVNMKIQHTLNRFGSLTLFYFKAANPFLKNCSDELNEWLIYKIDEFSKAL